jgi:hypothetical protein
MADRPTTEKWDIFEIELKGAAHGNPYLDVQRYQRACLSAASMSSISMRCLWSGST